MIKPQTKVSFYTLGCKLNYAESSGLGRQFIKAGYSVVGFEEEADICIINTCSVTENADKKCKNIVKEALKTSPNAYIIVVGCYAQLKPEAIANIAGVDLVLGAAEKFRLLEYIDSLAKKPKALVHHSDITAANTFVSAFSTSERTRSFLKVQDGCDYTCSFCTIPKARGISRSDTLENIIKNAEAILASSVKEIVLTGVNIGDYGKGEMGNKHHAHHFIDLLKALDCIPGNWRMRISSIEPNLLNPEIIDFIASSKHIVPHLHLPLQSGSNQILALMRRRYKRELYAQRVMKLKEILPDCCIGADVIVGFPGESQADFLETYQFLQHLPLSYLHVFTYSERAGTPAAQMKGAIPTAERAERSKMLHILSAKLRHAFYEQQIGKVAKVLFEGSNKQGLMHGFSANYVKVSLPFQADLVGKFQAIKLTELDDFGDVAGKIVTQSLQKTHTKEAFV